MASPNKHVFKWRVNNKNRLAGIPRWKNPNTRRVLSTKKWGYPKNSSFLRWDFWVSQSQNRPTWKSQRLELFSEAEFSLAVFLSNAVVWRRKNGLESANPRCSMGLEYLPDIYHKIDPMVGKNSPHGASGNGSATWLIPVILAMNFGKWWRYYGESFVIMNFNLDFPSREKNSIVKPPFGVTWQLQFIQIYPTVNKH